MTPRFQVPQAAIEALCQRHGIKRLSLFGSVLRPDFRPDSAKALLDAAPIRHKIVEEDKAQGLGQTLLDLLSHRPD